MPLIPEVGKTAEEADTGKSNWWSFKKLRGSVLVVLGYLLSPLSWWNDLVFNLPVAYGFGYLCNLISPGLLMPGAIVGYWLSNVIGILLMQAGLLDVVQKEPRQRSFKKEVFTGLLSSTAYTAVIVLLLQLKVLETPVLPLHF
ncbi:MAG TPA: hypothetical protein V6D19_17840, partial [Stenomitos sp.]